MTKEKEIVLVLAKESVDEFATVILDNRCGDSTLLIVAYQ